MLIIKNYYYAGKREYVSGLNCTFINPDDVKDTISFKHIKGYSIGELVEFTEKDEGKYSHKSTQKFVSQTIIDECFLAHANAVSNFSSAKARKLANKSNIPNMTIKELFEWTKGDYKKKQAVTDFINHYVWTGKE